MEGGSSKWHFTLKTQNLIKTIFFNIFLRRRASHRSKLFFDNKGCLRFVAAKTLSGHAGWLEEPHLRVTKIGRHDLQHERQRKRGPLCTHCIWAGFLSSVRGLCAYLSVNVFTGAPFHSYVLTPDFGVSSCGQVGRTFICQWESCMARYHGWSHVPL